MALPPGVTRQQYLDACLAVKVRDRFALRPAADQRQALSRLLAELGGVA
jgi:hypothetical protein